MTTVLTSALLASTQSAAAQPTGIAFALAIAVGVTALVAAGMSVADLLRKSRRPRRVSGLIAASAAGLVALSLVAGAFIVNAGVASAVADVPGSSVPISAVVEGVTPPAHVSDELQLVTLPLN